MDITDARIVSETKKTLKAIETHNLCYQDSYFKITAP